MSKRFHATRRRFIKCPDCGEELTIWVHFQSSENVNNIWIDYVSFEDKEKEQPSE